MYIAVCEDQKELANSLRRDIESYFENREESLVAVREYYDGQALLDADAAQPFDIIFMDIELPGISGMEAAKALRQRGSDALIVFVTAYSEFMATSFHVEAFDFLTKPVQPSDIARVLNRCVQKLNRQSGTIVVKIGTGAAAVRVRDILYISSSKHYLNIVTRDGASLRSMMTLNQMEDILKSYPQFVRCHQSYIANIDYVAELCREHFALQPAYQSIINKVPISRKYAPKVKDHFFRYYLNQI